MIQGEVMFVPEQMEVHEGFIHPQGAPRQAAKILRFIGPTGFVVNVLVPTDAASTLAAHIEGRSIVVPAPPGFTRGNGGT